MNNKYIFLVLLLIIGSVMSCKKFVEIDPPKDKLVEITVFASNETANAAMLNAYGQMLNGSINPFNLSLLTGLTGDELTSYSAGGFNDIYVNALKTDGGTVSSWNLAYNYIYLSNAIYEGCTKSSLLDPDVEKQIRAEALFIRAYWHFYLVNLYGEIPIITTTIYSNNAIVSRRPIPEVYAQILSDLQLAILDLKENYLGANALSNSDERIRPNKYSAIALLARVYLYNKEYSKAEAAASMVINNTSLYSLVDLNAVFLANSQEAIWQLKATTPNYSNTNTPEGAGFILTSSPLTSDRYTISPQLLNAFEDGDLRRDSWVGKFTDNTVTPNVDYYFPYKYKIKNGSNLTEYSMVFRLAEQYLIRAEAKAQQGNLPAAISDIDLLRKRAGLPLIIENAPNISKEDLLTAVLKERQVELFTEQGHRWLDLKRVGKIDAVMGEVTPFKGGVWKAEKQLWPIPKTEILNNPNIQQNKGYN